MAAGPKADGWPVGNERDRAMRLSAPFALDAVAVIVGAVAAMVITGALLRLF
jgi:hypothetical protein